MKVLVIDGSLASCKSIEKILATSTTYCCINSSSWKKYYDVSKPDVILLDIIMPGVDGVEVLQEIRAIDKDTPIIMISAIDDKDQIIRCLNLGADGYITKPILAEEIINLIRKTSLIDSVKRIITDTTNSLDKFKKHIIER